MSATQLLYSAKTFTQVNFGYARLFRIACFLPPLLFGATASLAQQVIRVTQTAWAGLAPPERDIIQQTYVVTLQEPNSYGVIIDNQAVNESTPGTSGGSALGGAIGNAAYIDNALKTGNYSAKSQLASGVLGAILGSALDSKPTAQFHFRYAVRLGSGDIQYYDHVKGDAFRHPVGVCVSVPSLSLIEQQICSQTTANLRATYIQTPANLTSAVIPIPPPPPSVGVSANAKLSLPIQIGGTVLVSNGAINGYQTPSISAKRLKEYADGTSFEVVVIMKDFIKVRDASNLLIWVESRGVAALPPSNISTIQSKTASSSPAHLIHNKVDLPPLAPLPSSQVMQTVSSTADNSSVQINCKLGTLAPVRTSAEKCKLINGSEVE